MKKSKEKIGDMIVTAAQMAALIGVSKRTVRDYAERGLLDRTEEGTYPVSGIKKYFVNLQSQAEKGGPEADLAAERAALTRVRVQESRMRLDAFHATYVPVTEAVDGWTKVAQIVRNRVLGQTERIGAKVPHLTAHDRAEIAALNREMLQAIAEETDALCVPYIRSTPLAPSN